MYTSKYTHIATLASFPLLSIGSKESNINPWRKMTAYKLPKLHSPLLKLPGPKQQVAPSAGPDHGAW